MEHYNDVGWTSLDEAAANEFDEKAKGMSSILYRRFSSRAELGYRIAISVARQEYPGDPRMSEINIDAIAKKTLDIVYKSLTDVSGAFCTNPTNANLGVENYLRMHITKMVRKQVILDEEWMESLLASVRSK